MTTNNNDVNSDNEENKPSPNLKETAWYENSIFVQIIRIAAVCGGLTVIYKFVKELIPPHDEVDIPLVKLILEGVNFTVLMSFCLYAIRVPMLNVKKPNNSNVKELSVLLNIQSDGHDSNEKLDKNIRRVNVLAKQLNDNVIFYCLTLMIVYLVFFLQGTSFKPFTEDIAKGFTDIFNFISAIFLYLAFKVLYNKTLDDDNNKMIYYMDALFTSFFYILIYSIYFKSKNVIVKNDLSLLSGIVNGLAMSLLFSRFVSMELNFVDIFKNPHFKSIYKYRKIFYFGTIFILPLYALVQPLFGDFTIKEFGNPDMFQNAVFFICFVGKLFFLLLFIIYIKKRLIHIYLHLVISKYGVSNDLLEHFDLKI